MEAFAIKGPHDGICGLGLSEHSAWDNAFNFNELFTKDDAIEKGYRCVPVQVTEMVPSICPRCGNNKWADFYRGPVPIAKVCTNTQCNHKIYNEGYAPPKEPK